MKLKEAQLLGILALIAVCIILLAMWGGDRDRQPTAMERGGAEEVEGSKMDEDLAELYRDLLVQEPLSEEEQSSEWPPSPTIIHVGGAADPSEQEADEEAAIRRVIEETEPERLGLEPPETTEESREPAEPEPPRDVTHVVQKGETLGAISRKYYGTTRKWKDILEANKNAVRDPRRLMPDTRLRIPSVQVAEAETAKDNSSPRLSTTTSAESGRVHLAKKGDTLFRIALKYYGDGSKWRRIHEANRDRLSKPQDLKPGMKIRVP